MAANKLPQPINSVGRFDRIYDLYRDCILNQEYYGYRLNLISRIGFWLEVTIVVGSGASGVSGWIIWTKYPAFVVLWGGIAAASTLLTTLMPVLRIDTKLKRYSTLFSAYRQLAISMKAMVDEISETALISKDTDKEISRIRAHYRNLSVDDDPRPSPKLVKRLQAEIEKRVPASSFVYPHFAAPSNITEAPAPSITGDVEGEDVKADAVDLRLHRREETP